MNRALGGGIALSLAGLAAYAAGVWVSYPGRAFSVMAVMVGLTLVAIGRSLDPAETDGDTERTTDHRDREGST
ncbi:MAG: hypothetical protein V5A44_07325 [Haloarculaceae archaeon]